MSTDVFVLDIVAGDKYSDSCAAGPSADIGCSPSAVPVTMSPLPSLLVTVLLSAGAARAGCPTNVDWREFEGSCYWRSTYPATWSAAVTACPTVGDGSQIASIHSLVENSFVMETYNYGETWIGLNDLGAEGQFTWSDGADLDFTNWQPGQPGQPG
ncbi:Lectin BRA-3 [Amphibalanus amphitrite]|uniref:Lectin BRA-3 n=1 Tax=Amphibalanus amphitrite TaxID=1232801 RepID=A0A6A4WMZ9_AMPAM|nr:Lectin BRA-3 [Amphibalanus amphitrite]